MESETMETQTALLMTNENGEPIINDAGEVLTKMNDGNLRYLTLRNEESEMTDSGSSSLKQDKEKRQNKKIQLNKKVQTKKDWNSNDTKLLLETYREYENKNDELKKSKTELFNLIADELNQHGISVTRQQCDDKIKSLVRALKVVVKNNNKTGRDRRTMENYDLLMELFGGRHSITPLVISGSGGTKVNVTNREEKEQPIVVEGTNDDAQSSSSSDSLPAIEQSRGSTTQNVRLSHNSAAIAAIKDTIVSMNETVTDRENKKLEAIDQMLQEIKKMEQLIRKW